MLFTSQGDGAGDNLPIGTILAYTGPLNKIPNGWALCNGANGTPNLSGRFLEGVTASAGTFKAAGLPNITGRFPSEAADFSGSGAFFRGNGSYGRGDGDSGTDEWVEFDASRSNPIYGASTTVQPNSYTVYYIMKIK